MRNVRSFNKLILDLQGFRSPISKSSAANIASLITMLYYSIGLQLLTRSAYQAILYKLDELEFNKPLTTAGVGPDANLLQQEMQNILLTWRLENTVESDPLTKSLLQSPKVAQIHLPYLTKIINDTSTRVNSTRVNSAGVNSTRVKMKGIEPSGSGEASGLSVILPCHNEHLYIERTVISILNETSPLVLKEIIVIDDFNSPPISSAISPELLAHPKLKIVRNDERQGLIRAKQVGGDMAKGEHLLFLDAHVKPFPRYLPWLLKDLNTRRSRIVVPSIPILDGDTWEQDGTAVGYKMMFDWQLRFNWFEDDDDEVPIMSGGLLALNKSWWNYTGGFDSGMDIWGGENIEQSVKTWMAGGEIVVNRQSLIAHYFRSKFPYSVDQTAVTRNKIRVAATWFDNWLKVIKAHIRSVSENSIDLTAAKKNREVIASNRNFDWYIDRFRKSLTKANLIHLPEFIISPSNDSKQQCLTVLNNSSLILDECDTEKDYWILEGSNPADVYPVINSQSLIHQRLSSHDVNYTKNELIDQSDCLEDPVCRKNGAILRNPMSGICIGAIKDFDPKYSVSGFYLGVSKNCLRDGTFRDFAKTVGFSPMDVQFGNHNSTFQDWNDIIWNRVLPKPTREFGDNGYVIKPNITKLSVQDVFRDDHPFYTGSIRWGSFCLDMAADRRPLTKICTSDKASQRWEFRFVNKPEDFWSLNK